MDLSELAADLDKEDPMACFRSRFRLPRVVDVAGPDSASFPGDAEEAGIYLAGNSLGLQPLNAQKAIQEELDRWGRLAVHGHVREPGSTETSDLRAAVPVAKLVGAAPDEVCVMGSLTANLHLLLLAFYRPTAERFKILCEERPFPSDFYALQSQAALRGFGDAVVEIPTRPGESCLRHEDLVAAIQQHGPQLALVCLSGVHFFTGQLFDIKALTAAAHESGAVIGWDLAHAVGNVPLALHDWDVDFAVWCHYKFVCGGAGGPGGAFVHNDRADYVRPVLHGWWGHEASSRFQMNNQLELSPGAAGFRLSSPCPISMALVRVGAELLLEAGMDNIRAKSERLTAYLELLLCRRLVGEAQKVDILTPQDPAQRGSQLSLKIPGAAAKVKRELRKRGITVDVRKPDVVRVTPKPLYNSFSDVFRFVEALEEILEI